jgi:hypothetical protein
MLCGAGLWASGVPCSAAREAHAGGSGAHGSGRRTDLEGVMILTFWMVLFMVLPVLGLGTFAFLMNRQQHQHHHR